MHLTIKRADPEDAGEVSTILCEAARYLDSIGQTLWDINDLTQEDISGDVAEGRYYLAYSDGEPVGTFRYQLEDRQYWPEITDGRSAFIHRLAVRRKAASGGISLQMIEWAKEHTKEIGREYLRLDCAVRPKLCSFYEGCGFQRHSMRHAGAYPVMRYVLRVNTC